MKGVQRLIPVVVIAALITGGYFLDRSRAACRSSMTGTFESQPSRLAPKTAGRVAEILVKEGDQVKAGAVLVRLSAPETGYDTTAANEQARQAEAKKREAENGARKEEIERQRAVVQQVQANLQKLINGARPEEIEAATQQVEGAQARYLELKRGSRPEEIAQAQGAVKEARARLDIVRRGPNPQERRQLEAQLRAAESDVDLASVDFERKRKLGDEGAIAGAQVDAARNALARARSSRDAAALAVERARAGSPPEEVRQAEAALMQATARLNEVIAGPRTEDVRAAEADLRAAEANLRLVTKGPRQEDIAAAQAQVDAAGAQLRELVTGNRKEDIDQAIAAAKAAQAEAGSVRERENELTVRAPKNGIVERVLVAKGDLAGPSSPVVQFDDPHDIWLRVYAPEASLARVQPGTMATLRVDGIEGDVLAKVESVATQGEFTPANLQTPEERGKQVFAIRLVLDKQDSRIKAGMGATVVRFGSQS